MTPPYGLRSEPEAVLPKGGDEIPRGPAGDDGLKLQVGVVRPDPVARDGQRGGDVGDIPRIDGRHRRPRFVPGGPQGGLGDEDDASA